MTALGLSSPPLTFLPQSAEARATQVPDLAWDFFSDLGMTY